MFLFINCLKVCYEILIVLNVEGSDFSSVVDDRERVCYVEGLREEIVWGKVREK